MNGKSIVIIGALAAGAYLLLSGSGGSGGGAEGGGSKKATAITGVVPGFDGGSGGSPGSGETPSGGSPGSSAPFQPSQYLMDLIDQKYSQSTPSKKEISASGTLGNVRFSGIDVAPNQTVELTDYGKSLSGLGIHTQSAYTTASSNPNEKMVFLDPFKTNVVGGGIHAVAAVTTKKSLSSFRPGGNANASNTFAYQNGLWTNTAIPGSYRDPSTGTWHVR